jgi:hypothetical protein
MKITEKQMQILFRVLEGTLSLYDRSDVNLFGFNQATRHRIYNEILNQQSDEITETKSSSVIDAETGLPLFLKVEVHKEYNFELPAGWKQIEEDGRTFIFGSNPLLDKK